MKRILLTLLLSVAFSVTACGLDTSARSAVLINGTTGEILYEKNIYERMPMASTTKIMTALLLAEQNCPERTLVATERMVLVEGSSMGLLPGDTVSYNDLLYGMLLASGNDAANTTAYALGGSIEGFVKLMNSKAKALGLLNTNFVTPSGLDDENHYTTSLDLARLAQYALRNELFAAAAASKTATLCYGNPPYKRSLRNHNRLLMSYPGMIGVKTGFTKKSGRCLVTAARRGSKYLIAVTLRDPDDWKDHTAMMDYGFSVLDEFPVKPGTDSADIPVIGGDSESVTVRIPEKVLGVTAQTAGRIETKIHLPHFLYAPVEPGSTVGKISYILDGTEIDSAEITAQTGASEQPVPNTSFFNRLYDNFMFLIKQL